MAWRIVNLAACTLSSLLGLPCPSQDLRDLVEAEAWAAGKVRMIAMAHPPLARFTRKAKGADMETASSLMSG